METSISKLTRQQLEQIFSQRIQNLCGAQMGHEPAKVICQLFDNKLAIVLEDSISRPVQFLLAHNDKDLAQQVRLNVELALKPQLKEIIEEVLGTPVIDLLTDTTLETGRTGIIAILASAPLSNDESDYFGN